MDLRSIARSLFAHPSRRFAVELWDGSILPPISGPAPGRVIFKAPAGLNILLPPVSERRVAEAFIADLIELEGNTIELLEATAEWSGPNLTRSLAGVLLWTAPRRLVSRGAADLAARLGGRIHSKARDRDAVRHHYDLSNEFYELFLDPLMVYSCAYFPSAKETLEEAQRAKLELICRKLNLQPEERLLDIGCGWGGLLLYAARHFSVRGIGLTLSQNQLAEAQRRLDNMQGRISAVSADYRELSGAPFDKVASIGMMEHVGESQIDAYFAKVNGLLRPGGLFLNHAIADISVKLQTIPWMSRRGGGFIGHDIFPDTELLPIGRVIQAAERAGFEVRDVESLREHYAETLARWLRRLERRFDEAASIVGRPRARAWRLYFASSAVAFRTGRVGVYQLLLAKRTPSGRSLGLPRTRADWDESQRTAGAPSKTEISGYAGSLASTTSSLRRQLSFPIG